MSIIDKTLAAAGIDGVQVDAKLDNTNAHIGDTLTGTLHVKGGRAEQEIRGLSVALACDAVITVDDDKKIVTREITDVPVGEAFTIAPNEHHELRFELAVPVGTPVDAPLRTARSRTYVVSAADVALALDPDDVDEVTVPPTQLHEDVKAAMDALGFRFNEGEVEGTKRGPIQEFEFVPKEPGGRIGEVDIAFLPHGNDYRLAVETELRANTGLGFLSQVLDADLDEQKNVLTPGGGSQGPGQEAIEEMLRELLER